MSLDSIAAEIRALATGNVAVKSLGTARYNAVVGNWRVANATAASPRASQIITTNLLGSRLAIRMFSANMKIERLKSGISANPEKDKESLAIDLVEYGLLILDVVSSFLSHDVRHTLGEDLPVFDFISGILELFGDPAASENLTAVFGPYWSLQALHVV